MRIFIVDPAFSSDEIELSQMVVEMFVADVVRYTVSAAFHQREGILRGIGVDVTANGFFVAVAHSVTTPGELFAHAAG